MTSRKIREIKYRISTLKNRSLKLKLAFQIEAISTTKLLINISQSIERRFMSELLKFQIFKIMNGCSINFQNLFIFDFQIAVLCLF